MCTALLLGCEKHNESWPNANQLILFQVEYNNYAWGYDHRGIIIDSSGTVRSFTFPENWHHPDTEGYLSESDMNENIEQLDTGMFSIDKNELFKHFSKLQRISEGELSEPKNTANDAGETDFSGYLYDLSKKQYKHVLIKREGDWSIDNNAPDAEEVIRWLMKVYLDQRRHNMAM